MGDCEIPLVLRDKLYVDFRTDNGQGFELLDRSLRRISNPAQSRIDRQDFHTDGSVDCGTIKGSSIVEWLFVDHGGKVPYCVVTRYRLVLDSPEAEGQFKDRLRNGTHPEYACTFLSIFLKEVKDGVPRVTIQDENEISETHRLGGEADDEAILHIGTRRLGIDNGMDTLFTVDDVLGRAVSHTLSVQRTPEVSSHQTG